MYRHDFCFYILISIVTKIRIEKDFLVTILVSSIGVDLRYGWCLGIRPWRRTTSCPVQNGEHRNKNTSATPQQGRNLNFFFNQQKQIAALASQLLPKEPDLKPTTEGLTDEEYVRKLAKDWAKEGGAASLRPRSVVRGSKQGVKRQRSRSPVGTVNTMQSFVLDDTEKKTPEATPNENKETTLHRPTHFQEDSRIP